MRIAQCSVGWFWAVCVERMRTAPRWWRVGVWRGVGLRGTRILVPVWRRLGNDLEQSLGLYGLGAKVWSRLRARCSAAVGRLCLFWVARQVVGVLGIGHVVSPRCVVCLRLRTRVFPAIPDQRTASPKQQPSSDQRVGGGFGLSDFSLRSAALSGSTVGSQQGRSRPHTE